MGLRITFFGFGTGSTTSEYLIYLNNWSNRSSFFLDKFNTSILWEKYNQRCLLTRTFSKMLFRFFARYFWNRVTTYPELESSYNWCKTTTFIHQQLKFYFYLLCIPKLRRRSAPQPVGVATFPPPSCLGRFACVVSINVCAKGLFFREPTFL